jgi:hypothetical protein
VAFLLFKSMSCYNARRLAWIRRHNIQIGQRVLITHFEEGRGWSNEWTHDMEDYVGEEGTIVSLDCFDIEVGFWDGDSWWFPYFVLKPL